MSHGFTGSPWPMRPWASALAAHGHRVHVPLLPGHGTSWQDLNTTRWTDWYDALDHAFRRLRAECDQVFVAGLSMGGALALRLAQEHGRDVAGLMLVNPAIGDSRWRFRALPTLARFRASSPALGGDIKKPGVTDFAYRRTPLRAAASMLDLWRRVQQDLIRVDQPVLAFQSRTDHVIDGTSARLIREGTGSSDLTIVDLENSFHVATLDHDAPVIAERSRVWLSRHH